MNTFHYYKDRAFCCLTYLSFAMKLTMTRDVYEVDYLKQQLTNAISDNENEDNEQNYLHRYIKNGFRLPYEKYLRMSNAAAGSRLAYLYSQASLNTGEKYYYEMKKEAKILEKGAGTSRYQTYRRIKNELKKQDVSKSERKRELISRYKKSVYGFRTYKIDNIYYNLAKLAASHARFFIARFSSKASDEIRRLCCGAKGS